MDNECDYVVVIGASAGGIEAVARVLHDVPSNAAAALFVVVHLNASAPSMLATVLARRTELNVVPTEDGMEIRCGTVYIAPPDWHLLVDDGVVRLGRGPRENNFRPAVDPLFRTAAASHGPHVIGIILSGNLDDGTAGMLEVKRCGGTAIVQDPDDALYPGMPASVLQEVPHIDYVLPIDEIGRLLSKLIGTHAGDGRLRGGQSISTDIAIGGDDPVSADEREASEGGDQSSFGCPSCGGVLWEQREGELVRYRCRVGHMFSDEALLAAQTENLETALWTALRALEEAGEQSTTLAQRMESRGHPALARRFSRQADEAVRRAAIVREALTLGHVSPEHAREAG